VEINAIIFKGFISLFFILGSFAFKPSVGFPIAGAALNAQMGFKPHIGNTGI
jgi:hypothetical protein